MSSPIRPLLTWLRGGTASRSASLAVRPGFVCLESRDVPAAFVVANTNDDGDGSLRKAITDANANGAADTITFAPALAGQTITLESELLINGSEELDITGPGSSKLTVQGKTTGLFHVTLATADAKDVSISSLTMTKGAGVYTLNPGDPEGGGAVRNNGGKLFLQDVVISNSKSAAGGAIFQVGKGTLTVRESTITGNSADIGGGIYSFTGTLLLINSTVTANSSKDDGGGVQVGNTDSDGAIINSTIAFNRADSDGDGTGKGGGVFVEEFAGAFGNVILRNTIVAGNLVGTGTTASDLGGFNMNADSKFNLVSDAATAGGLTNGKNSNIVGVDTKTVLSSTLASVSGATPTLALITGSKAINAGDKTLAQDETGALLTTDQTFRTRVVGSQVDLGAFEVQLPIAPQQYAVGADKGSAAVKLFNQDKTERFTIEPFPGFTGGVRVAAADFNGDGIADLVAGTGPGRATKVVVLSGVDGKTELFNTDPFEASFTGGVYVAVGDINGDGTPDLIITPDEGGGPRARIFGGKDFKQISDFFGIDDKNFRGGARAATGDINGDGRADLIVVAGFGGGPRVAMFDGSKLAGDGGPKLVGDFAAFEDTLRNGIFVTAGDVDGDGFADLIAGGGPGGGPRVSVFDGKDLLAGKQTRDADFFSGPDSNRGGVRLAVKDLDGDTRVDVLTGAGTANGSKVIAYAGSKLAGSTPPELFSTDTFSGFSGGVFVG